MNCPECGTELDQNNYCDECGEEFEVCEECDIPKNLDGFCPECDQCPKCEKLGNKCLCDPNDNVVNSTAVSSWIEEDDCYF